MALFINLDSSINRSCAIGEADPFLARLLERFVKKSGLRTKRAQTGEALLDLVEREKPALIILEPQLPGKVKGWEAYQQLKVEPETCHIPVIICSWLNEDEVYALIGSAPIHLQKPELHYEDFAAALEAVGLVPDEPVNP